jgi:hypothetical protein
MLRGSEFKTSEYDVKLSLEESERNSVCGIKVILYHFFWVIPRRL